MATTRQLIDHNPTCEFDCLNSQHACEFQHLQFYTITLYDQQFGQNQMVKERVNPWGGFVDILEKFTDVNKFTRSERDDRLSHTFFYF